MNVNNKNPGVADYESKPSQYSDGVIGLNLSDPTYDQRKMCEQEVEEHLLGLIMAHQYSMKKSIKLFGEKGEEATLKELKQIHDMDTYTPITASDLTYEQKRKALSALLFPT